MPIDTRRRDFGPIGPEIALSRPAGLLLSGCSSAARVLQLRAGMPFKSKAQRRKFAELLVEGKIKPETYEEWNRSTGSKRLPERIHPKRKTATRSRSKKRKS